MKKDNRLTEILLLTVAIVHILMGIFVVIFSHDSFEKDHVYIGLIILFSSIPSILIYFLGGRYKNPYKIPYNFFALYGIIAGLVFIFKEDISMTTMCVMWGVYDIVRSLYEIFDASREFKENKLEIVEIICAVAELVFGIILCIKLDDGIYIHLIVMGISLILVGVKHLLDFIKETNQKNKEVNK